MEDEQKFKAPTINTLEEAQSAIDELALHRANVDFITNHFELIGKEPYGVIKALVADLPDSPQIISREERDVFLEEQYLENGMRSSVDSGKVSVLESYLIHLIGRHYREALQVDTFTASTGDSFSKVDSVQILRDEVRTKRFLQGVQTSVVALEKVRDDEIFVCDAGCGALPILGVYAALQSEKIRCICLEKNPEAITMAKALVASLGLEDRVTIIQCDARTYEPEKKIDLLVSETMDTGLLNEPMCEILQHLGSYTADDAKILPHKIITYAGISTVDMYTNAETFTLIDKHSVPILDVNWVQTGEYIAGEKPLEIESRLEVPNNEQDTLVLVASEVTVDINVPPLTFNESRLSVPVPVNVNAEGLFKQIPTNKGHLRITYSAGNHAQQVRLE